MKFKIIFAILLLSVLVENVPLTHPKEFQINPTPRDDFKSKRDMKIFEETDLLFPLLSDGVFADEDEGVNYRLPNDSRPIRYDLWLKTDVEKENFDFEGRVKIHLEIVEPTQLITLHYRQIKIDNIDLLKVDGTLDKANLSFDFNEQLEFLKISLPNTFQMDAKMILDIKYTGKLREDGSGFYRASYRDENNKQVWFATTQFEMTDARHAMPCYDEPGIRAITSLSIQHNKNYDAISNMPVIKVDPLEGTDYVTTSFEDTIPMQSYLLAFIISDYAYVSDEDNRVEQRVYAKPQSIAAGDGNYTLSVVGPILRKLEEHFGVDYPLPKMDHAAIEDYIWGAMENFGLITYREGAILYNPDKNTESLKTNIRELVAHEYVHQYFGNIVAPSWWAYTWLNEGFATLYSYYIPYLVFPESNHMDRFQNALNAAFNVDVGNSKPLNFYVQTPSDIRAKFGTISYQKGGSFLRMFQEALTIPTFTKGLNFYLKMMYLSTATPQDLHRALQMAYDLDFPNNEVNLDQIMTTWEDQAGYPIVSVQKSGNRYIFTQKRYGGGDEIYTIPLSYTTKSQANFEIKTPKIWMSEGSGEVQSSDDWMILNIQGTGYYRVNYHESVWKGLVDQLQTNHELIPQLHRIQLFKNMRTNLLEESIDLSYGLEILSSLEQQNEAAVWDQAVGVELVYSDHLIGTSMILNYQELLKMIVSPHISRLGYEKLLGESEEDTNLRPFLITMSCKAQIQECFNYQREKLSRFIDTGEGAFETCEGLRNADATLHSKMIAKLIGGESFSARASFLNNLGCPLNKALIENYLKTLIDPINSLTPAERTLGMIMTFRKSSLAMDTVFDFVDQNYEEIHIVTVGRLTSIIDSLPAFINSESHSMKLKQILVTLRGAGFLSETDVEQISSAIDMNVGWTERNFASIESWFGFETTVLPTTAQPSTNSPTTASPSTNSPTTASPVLPTDPTTSTTLGSATVATSMTIMAICSVIKLLF